MKKQNVRTLGLIVCTFTYLLIGAAIFDAIESEEEQRQKEALVVLEEQLLRKYNISEWDFELLEELIYLEQPYKAGMPWKFAGSFYYATTVLTTIGYGHSTPKTDGGKIFTMVYAMIGIPLGLVMFNSIGERLNNFSSIVINKLRVLLKAKQAETTEVDLILVVTSLSIIVVTLGAAAFSHYEGWSYFHSIYYCFVTLTTIGFGDYVALQQDNSLEKKPEYVTFALFFIMFGLAIIAAALNLLVLKFMTMNTEDEKRDEQQAIQAAARSVRLDGDIILQQSEVLHWQAEGAGSMEEIRSVCSCTCNSCNPFQQVNTRRLDEAEDGLRLKMQRSNPRSRKASRWFSQTSMFSQATSADEAGSGDGGGGTAADRADTPTTTLDDYCDYRERMRRNKADSIHDLRRSTVSSVLRLPPSTPPNLRPASRAKTCCAAAAVAAAASSASSGNLVAMGSTPGSVHPKQNQHDQLAAALLQQDPYGWPASSSSRRRPGGLWSRILPCASSPLTSPSLSARLRQERRLPPSNRHTLFETDTEKRESYALDEVDTIKAVPLALNANHHKRVSL